MNIAVHPAALERCIPADPREAVRDRYRDLATQDRPGDPCAVPFDARRVPFRQSFGGSILIGLAGVMVFCGLIWTLVEWVS